MTKDTINLRDDADFEIEVFRNVFWIPANILGKTRYTDEDIKSIVLLDPAEKKRKINNLYEAVQLFQASRFKGIIDNVRVLEEDTAILWVFHKTGFDSIRTNEGCCAADSNWLSYILNGVYDETGCFGFRQSDGNGHLTSYIKHDGWHYFLDMMMQRHDSAQNIGIESGNIDDFYKNEAFGYIYKAKSFKDYIDYCFSVYNNPPVLFYKTTNSECLGIGTEYYWQTNDDHSLCHLMQKSEKTLFYINSVEILYSKNDVIYEFKNTKAVEPDWSSIKSFDFQSL